MAYVAQKCSGTRRPKRVLRPSAKQGCKEKWDKIDETLNKDTRKEAEKTGKEGEGEKGLKQRFEEQIGGDCRPETNGWDGHDEAIDRKSVV